MIIDKIKDRLSGIITYGLTPPKLNLDPERITAITNKHIDRINTLPIDALVLYDLQDEKERITENRPFPFLPTIDPYNYATNELQQLQIPKIVYRSVGKYTETELKQFLLSPEQHLLTVFVGVASREQKVSLTLKDAYQIYKENNTTMLLGGVTIPERHKIHQNEHLRVKHKVAMGCRFFITQAVYNTENARNFLSDYYYNCQEEGIPCQPIIFTLSPCGSEKTLHFMKWLGIDIPKWLENDLLHARDILEMSYNHCLSVCNDMIGFCVDKNIPMGFNIESVSIRKEEIDTAIELVHQVYKKLHNTGF